MTVDLPPRAVVWSDLAPDAPCAYADGLHAEIAAALRDDGVDALTATIDDQAQGLPPELLDGIDVLVWWAHRRHAEVADELAARVQDAVLGGMGLVVLHSAAHSKPFLRLMGTSCAFHWREADDRELIWTIEPAHPIAAGLGPVVALERHEMYGERFDIPAPDELVFVSSFSGGEVFRSGCCFRRGRGRVFYFGPGHQTDPVYGHPQVRRILANAVRWARSPQGRMPPPRPAHAPSGWFEG
jgi:trehalose utilization protein